MPSPKLLPEVASQPESDRFLLNIYIEVKKEEAFTRLTRRYSALVIRAIQPIFPEAIDDITQATFLLLHRKAAILAKRESVAGWLYETARRLAMKARQAQSRRSRHEKKATLPTASSSASQISFDEVREAVHKEVDQLPDLFRLPLLLRYWEGLTRQQAAKRLGCSLSTFHRRLDAAQDRLSKRLKRHSSDLLTVLSITAASQVNAGTIFSMSKSVTPLTLQLVQESIRNKSSMLLMGMFLVGLLGLGIFLGLRPVQAKDDDKAATTQTTPPTKKLPTTLDLPPGAIARLLDNPFHHGERIIEIAASNDGKYILTRGNRLAKLWNAKTGEELPLGAGKIPLRTHGDLVYHGVSKIKACGDRLLLLGDLLQTQHPPRLTLVDAVTGQVLNEKGINPVDPKTPSIMYSGSEIRPDGKAVAYIEHVLNEKGSKMFLREWNAETNQTETITETGMNFATDVFHERLLYSPDGKYLMVRTLKDGANLQVWDLRKKEPIKQESPWNWENVTFSPDSQTIAGIDGRSLKLCSFNNSPTVQKYAIDGEESERSMEGMIFIEDGKALTIKNDGLFRRIDLTNHKWSKLVIDFPQHSNLWCVNRSNELILANYDTLIFRDIASGKRTTDRVGEASADARWISDDGLKVSFKDISSSSRPVIRNSQFSIDWNTLTEVEKKSELPQSERKSDPDFPIAWRIKNPFAINSFPVLKSKDEFRIVFHDNKATEGREVFVATWKVHTQELTKKLELLNQWPTDFNSTGDKFLVETTGERDSQSLQLLNYPSGKVIGAVTKNGHIGGACFSPDCRSIGVKASVESNAVIRLIETSTLKERMRFDGRTTELHSLAFHTTRKVLATNAGRSILLWDISAARLPKPSNITLAWEQLLADDAAIGYAGIQWLVDHPAEAIPLLKQKLQPVPVIEERQIDQWLADLDAERAALRETASEKLSLYVEQARMKLELNLANAKSKEVTARLQTILAADPTYSLLTGERLRQARAMEALEWMANDAAKVLLKELAKGAKAATLTIDAVHSLQRLGNR